MKLYKIVFLYFFLLLLPGACSDEDEMENKGVNEPLEVTASKEGVVLDGLEPDEQAVKFSWTTGTDHGTGFAIVYTLQFSLDGDNFADGVSIELGRNVYEKTYKNAELNEFLIDKLGISPLNEITLEYRLTAKLTSGEFEEQISPVKTIKITTYKPFPESLFLSGSALPEGVNPSMVPMPGLPCIFKWEGELVQGDVWFISSLGAEFPSYYKGAGENALYLRENENDLEGIPFTIPGKNFYVIYVDLVRMTFHLEMDTPKYTNLWIGGAGTDWTLRPMEVDPEDPYVFYYTGMFTTAGGLKIMTRSDWSGIVLRPPVDGIKNGVNLDVVEGGEVPDNKWDVRFLTSTAHITLNIRTMKIDIVKKSNTISLVGDASPGGWATNVTNMTLSEDGNIFTWSGPMTPGVFRLSCNGQWGEDMYFPAEHDQVPTGYEEPAYAYRPDGKDTNWKIEEAGNYYIELNQMKETILIRKQ